MQLPFAVSLSISQWAAPVTRYFRPPTKAAAYATELRNINGEEVNCVLLDSVQSQANRMELALLEEWASGKGSAAGYHRGLYRRRPAQTLSHNQLGSAPSRRRWPPARL